MRTSTLAIATAFLAIVGGTNQVRAQSRTLTSPAELQALGGKWTQIFCAACCVPTNPFSGGNGELVQDGYGRWVINSEHFCARRGLQDGTSVKFIFEPGTADDTMGVGAGWRAVVQLVETQQGVEMRIGAGGAPSSVFFRPGMRLPPPATAQPGADPQEPAPASAYTAFSCSWSYPSPSGTQRNPGGYICAQSAGHAAEEVRHIWPESFDIACSPMAMGDGRGGLTYRCEPPSTSGQRARPSPAPECEKSSLCCIPAPPGRYREPPLRSRCSTDRACLLSPCQCGVGQGVYEKGTICRPTDR